MATPLSHRAGLTLACLLLTVAAPASSTAAETSRTNVVFILADDLGGKDLGCYGSTYYRTPNLDRLAAAGVRFTASYAACPVCSPSRAALLTGKYPARLHLTDWLPGRADRPDQKLLRPDFNKALPVGETTIADVLSANGYATGHFGKWHLGGGASDPRKRGFGVSIGGDNTGAQATYFAPFRGPNGRFLPGLEKAADGEYLTDRLTTEAIHFIEQNRDRPFFVYLAHNAPHIPLKAKPEVVAKYRSDGPPGTQNNPIYAAMIESLDDNVGRILQKLDELKLTERTAVIFNSDNGGLSILEGPDTPATSNAPFREAKGFVYEGGIRVPLIVRWPGVTKRGTVSDVPVCGIDLFPTLVDLCGLPSTAKVDGVSIRPTLTGASLPRRDLFWHYPHYSNQGGRPGAAIRAGSLKLVELYEDGRRELYDLAKDVGETHNLIAERPEEGKALAARLEAWRRSVDAQMLRPNPGFVPNPQSPGGVVTLPARTAEIHGIQVRYESVPHKNTLGFWTRVEDQVSWEFTLNKPGTFSVEALQGCGKGQGGSEVDFDFGGQKLRMTVEDTGGYQDFRPREIGSVTLDKPGRYTLTVRPVRKAGVAVMDLRSVTLRPAR
jgi:arylsulfatase A-like enzyme